MDFSNAAKQAAKTYKHIDNLYFMQGDIASKTFVDGEEHKFSLQELISSSSVFKERRKKVRTVFLISLLLTGALQVYGFTLEPLVVPSGMSTFFQVQVYVALISVPLLISGIVSFLAYLLLRISNKEVRTMDSILKEHLS